MYPQRVSDQGVEHVGGAREATADQSRDEAKRRPEPLGSRLEMIACMARKLAGKS